MANVQLQTLRFVQSLPKRERQPLSNKFKNADPLGMFDIEWECLLLNDTSNRPPRGNARVRSEETSSSGRSTRT